MMTSDRQFGFPYGGYGFGYPGYGFGYPGFGYPGFGYPFFHRRFSPFFFLSPFRFPFFRGDEDRNEHIGMHHQCHEGETLGTLAERYNVPPAILEAMNPHIQFTAGLQAGVTVMIPRMDRMYCHRMYMEHPSGEIPAQSFPMGTEMQYTQAMPFPHTQAMPLPPMTP